MERDWPGYPGSRRIRDSWEVVMWMLICPCLKGGPGLMSNGWVSVLQLRRERRCVTFGVYTGFAPYVMFVRLSVLL